MPVNFAIIGPGRIADNSLAPGLAGAPGARLWSVLSRDRNRAGQFAERHGAAASNPAHDRLDELLADAELDAVIVASPDRLHAEQTIAAARAGKHVLVEKPMATDIDSARGMVEACREAGVKLGVAYHMRWHAGHRALTEKIQSGTLGALRHVRVQWSFRASDATDWRASPEVGKWWSLGAVGTHCLDLIRWLMLPDCGEVVEIESTISRAVWNGPHDETAVVSLRFESGASAVFCSSVLFQAPSRMEVYGSVGFAECVGTIGPHGAGRIEIGGDAFAFAPVDPYAGEIQDFADAITDDRDPEVNGEEGLRNVELLLATAP